MIGNSENRNKLYDARFDRDKVLRRLITEPNPVIFDVGANNGSSLEQFHKLWPDGLFHCFEPQEECWPNLEIVGNNIGVDKVKIQRCAVGESNQSDVPFYSHPLTSGQSGLVKINLRSKDSLLLNSSETENLAKNFQKQANQVRSVKTICLDSYMEENKIKDVAILKVDTQGYEAEVLKGVGDKLRDVKVVLTELMFFDFYEKTVTFSDIEKFLIPNGFSLFDISFISKNPMNGRTDWVDVIYINNKKL